MKGNYMFVDARKLAKAIANAPLDVLFDITFDDEDSVKVYGEPTGWHGIKITKLFDEEGGVLCFGYYGYGNTKCVALYSISKDIYDTSFNADAIEDQLLEWFYDEDDYNHVLCVEVTVENEEYLMEV